MQLTQPKGMVSKETNKEAIARVFGLKKKEVDYLKEGVDVAGYKILFDPDTQLCFWTGDATGNPLTWTISDYKLTLVTPAGSFSLSQATAGDWLKSSLASSIGASLVTSTGGDTVQDALDTIYFGVSITSADDLRAVEPITDGQKMLGRINNKVAYWIYDASNTTTVDNGWFCIVTATGKRWLREGTKESIDLSWVVTQGSDMSGAWQQAIDFSVWHAINVMGSVKKLSP